MAPSNGKTDNQQILTIVRDTQKSVQDVIEAVSAFSTNVDKRFDGTNGEIKGIKGRLVKIESTMVTKDYLDEKLSDLKGDLVVLVRKEDRKLASLIDVLIRKSIISADDAKRILALEPFPQS